MGLRGSNELDQAPPATRSLTEEERARLKERYSMEYSRYWPLPEFTVVAAPHKASGGYVGDLLLQRGNLLLLSECIPSLRAVLHW